MYYVGLPWEYSMHRILSRYNHENGYVILNQFLSGCHDGTSITRTEQDAVKGNFWETLWQSYNSVDLAGVVLP